MEAGVGVSKNENEKIDKNKKNEGDVKVDQINKTKRHIFIIHVILTILFFIISTGIITIIFYFGVKQSGITSFALGIVFTIPLALLFFALLHLREKTEKEKNKQNDIEQKIPTKQNLSLNSKSSHNYNNNNDDSGLFQLSMAVL